MLANVWFAMNDAIPRIVAQESLDAFTIEVAANPYVEQKARDEILSNWQRLVQGGWRPQPTPARGSRDDRPALTVDGEPIVRHTDLPLREIHRILGGEFGRGIKLE
jgi:hypothetical protein